VDDEGESPADVADGHGYDGCEDIAGLIRNWKDPIEEDNS
jgi:hypothetical protein